MGIIYFSAENARQSDQESALLYKRLRIPPMAHKAPGKADRNGISLAKLFKLFPDDAAAEKWFARQRWGDEPACPYCGSLNVQSGSAHKTMPYRCR